MLTRQRAQKLTTMTGMWQNQSVIIAHQPTSFTPLFLNETSKFYATCINTTNIMLQGTKTGIFYRIKGIKAEIKRYLDLWPFNGSHC